MLMPKKTQLSVANPCHEHWGDMRPNNDGRYCDSCQKTVVDFTMVSDQEILTWLSGAGNSVCGRFMGDQLNRNLSPATTPRKNRWEVWQFLLAGLLISSEVSAQEQPPQPPVSQTDKKTDREDGVVAGLVMRIPSPSSHITVQVVDLDNGQPVPGATVRIDKHMFSAVHSTVRKGNGRGSCYNIQNGEGKDEPPM